MNRYLLISFLWLSASNGWSEVILTPNPADPDVRASDLFMGNPSEIVAKGPWTEIKFSLKNEFNEPIAVLNLQLIVKTAGTEKIYDFPVGWLTLSKDEVKDIGPKYIGEMPSGSSFDYDVSAAVSFKRNGKLETSQQISFKTH